MLCLVHNRPGSRFDELPPSRIANWDPNVAGRCIDIVAYAISSGIANTLLDAATVGLPVYQVAKIADVQKEEIPYHLYVPDWRDCYSRKYSETYSLVAIRHLQCDRESWKLLRPALGIGHRRDLCRHYRRLHSHSATVLRPIPAQTRAEIVLIARIYIRNPAIQACYRQDRR